MHKTYYEGSTLIHHTLATKLANFLGARGGVVVTKPGDKTLRCQKQNLLVLW